MIGVTIKSTLQNVKKCRLALSTKLFTVCRLSRGSCPCYSKANSSIDVSSVCPRQEPLTCYIHVYLHINVSNIFEIKYKRVLLDTLSPGSVHFVKVWLGNFEDLGNTTVYGQNSSSFFRHTYTPKVL